jgi:hypothetical protein
VFRPRVCCAIADQRPWSRYSSHPDELEVVTGMSRAQFDVVFDTIWVPLVRYRAAYHQHEEDGTPFLLPRNMLVLALHWLRHYPTFDLLGIEYGVDHHTANRIVHFVVREISDHLGAIVNAPAGLRSRYSDEPLAGICCFVDSFFVGLPRPGSDAERRAYFTFKGRHSKFGLKAQITVGLDGVIWMVSDMYPGPASDKRIFEESEIREVLERTGLKAGADRGYRNIDETVTPLFRYNDYEELEWEIAEPDHVLQQNRATVERAIERMRNWQVLGCIYRGAVDLDFVSHVCKAVASLVNLTSAGV